MSYEPVDFRVVDTTPTAGPIGGALIKIYNRAGTSLFTELTTDADGRAGALLSTGVEYQLRIFKFGVGFTNPLIFEVLEAPSTNQFLLTGVVLATPTANDARLCRASGTFRGADGQPARHVEVHFRPKFSPILLEGAPVTSNRILTRTDRRGLLVVDLIRFGEYDVLIQGMEDQHRTIFVPDLPSVNIGDLIFPVIGEVSFTPEGPLELTVGEDLPLEVAVETTSGLPMTGTAAQEVIWETADPSVAAVLVESDRLVIRGLSTGTTVLTARRRDTTIIRIPDPGISGVPVPITVA